MRHAAPDPAFDRAERFVHVRGEIVVAEAAIVGKYQRLSLGRRQFAETLAQPLGGAPLVLAFGLRASLVMIVPMLAVAAFLLTQRGYEVISMQGGMNAWEGETVC